MPCCSAGVTYDVAAPPVAIGGGGLVVPKFTSYDVAPVLVHDSATGAASTPVAALEGEGVDGAEGG